MAYPGGPPVGIGAMPSAPPQHQEKFDSAVEFLERVKVVYAAEPAVYNQFLDIMKGFKTHTLDTTGVIKRVKQLFKGHPELTRGFATFLPKEYKIDVEQGDEEDDGEAPGQTLTPHQQYAVQAQQAAAAAATQQMQAQAQAQMGAGRAPVEVGEEHARLYVKKIKNRFVNQPQIYKNFLEILHTFHREKHSIQEVYAQVAQLFRDHPDLLSEFAHFLPDPSAPQQTLQVQHQQQQGHVYAQHGHDDHHLGQQHKQPVRGAGARAAGRVLTEPPSRVPSRSQTASSMAASSMQHGVGGRGAVTGSMGSSTRGAAAAAAGATMGAPPPLHSAIPGADGANKERSHGTFDELMHFFKLKQVLPQNDYEEFLKLLAMYNADVLTKAELYFMVRDLLRHQDLDLLDWFRKFMQVEDLKDEDSHGYLADYDWSASEKLGPSYRSMPRPWAQWKCSGRTGNAICAEVLNDAWISVPTGTEEGAFKNSRKNQYEELLFKCEDDRFELDLLVEGNASAIRALEITLTSFRTLSPTALATFQLNEGDLSVLTVKAIRRVYGPRADEFIKLIMGKPAVAIPVVLARLKAKDTEWNIARREWNVLWKQIFKKNYHKQLDHRSSTFKQDEKKMLTAKALFAELRRASGEQKSNGGTGGPGEDITASSSSTHRMETDEQKNASNTNVMQVDGVATATITSSTEAASPSALGGAGTTGSTPISGSMSAAAASAASQSAVGSPTLSFIIAQPNLFADIRHLLRLTFITQYPKADVPKFNTLWNSLICPFFHVDSSVATLAPTDDDPNSSEPNALNDNPSSGTDFNSMEGMGAGMSSMDIDQTSVKVEPSVSANGSGMAATSISSNNASAPTSSTPAPPAQSAPNKPISTEMASKPATHHMLFLGNDSFYLLFRYLQILYDRMAEAWMFSEEYPQIHNPPIVEIDPKQPLSEIPPDVNNPPNTNSQAISASVQAQSAANTASSPNAKTEEEEPLSSATEPQVVTYTDPAPSLSPVTRYQNFLRRAGQLVTGMMEQQTFEEQSRHDFGISCFPLFTIDKLLLLLAKQFHVVNSDETSEKLAGLYHYEVSRNMGGFTDAVYLSNCREVLSNDKHAYVFTFDWSNDSQILGITEVDLGHPSFGLEHNEELSNYINRLATNDTILAKKAQRLQQAHGMHHHMSISAASVLRDIKTEGDGFSSSSMDATNSSNGVPTPHDANRPNGETESFPPSRDSPSPGAPFLKRNLGSLSAPNGAPTTDSAASAQGDDSTPSEDSSAPVIQNELGVKVVPGTFKLRFVGNTEDSLRRPGRKTSHQVSDDKIQLDALAENAALPSPMDS